MAADRRVLIQWISIIFSITTAMLVLLGALVMMYGNFELGLILFVLGLVLVISNESIFPRLHRPSEVAAQENRLIEEVANLAAIGYTPPLLLGSYLYFSGQQDFKLIIFMGVTFVVVTMKIFAKVWATHMNNYSSSSSEVYAYRPNEEYSEPGV